MSGLRLRQRPPSPPSGGRASISRHIVCLGPGGEGARPPRLFAEDHVANEVPGRSTARSIPIFIKIIHRAGSIIQRRYSLPTVLPASSLRPPPGGQKPNRHWNTKKAASKQGREAPYLAYTSSNHLLSACTSQGNAPSGWR
jgi:hypothetical protein